MKKIKIGVKDVDQLEFELLEDSQKGDYFSLKELNKIDFSTLEKTLKNKKDEIVKKMFEENKSFHIEQDEEFKKYKASFNKRDSEIESAKKSVELEFQSNILKLEKEIVQLKEQEKIQISKYKESEEYLKLKEDADNWKDKKENLDKEIEAKSNRIALEQTKSKDNKIEELQEQIKKLELMRNKRQNIKVMGTEFENWIQNELNRSQVLMDTINLDTKINAQPKPIGGKKPDFVIDILGENDVKLERLIIEAKTEERNGSTKNADHYQTLETNTKNFQGTIAILISELEFNDDYIDWGIKTIKGKKDMYVVRPQYFMTLIYLILRFALLKNSLESVGIEFKTKQEINEEFNELKQEITANALKSINSNIESINKAIEKSRSGLNEIESNSLKIETHIQTIQNKLNNFKIKKLINKIEALNKN